MEYLSKEKSCILLLVTGKNAEDKFKHEPGKHCVQRIPPTESKGRTHTSTVSVAVLPVRKKHNFILDDKDIDVQATKGSGPGGQRKNKVSTAIRMIHKPTGLSVFIDGRSQYQNKSLARSILEEKIRELNCKKENKEHNIKRLKQLANRSRSNKVRTYNFKKRRVVDHKLGTKTSKIEEIMNGKFELITGE